MDLVRWWLTFETKPFQFWLEIWIQVLVILLQLYQTKNCAKHATVHFNCFIFSTYVSWKYIEKLSKIINCSQKRKYSYKFICTHIYFQSMNHLFTCNSMQHNQPDFITPLRNLTVEVGRNATFECFVTGIKKFRVSPFTLFIPQFLNT